MDDIKTSGGRIVGSWNGERARDLMAEIARIKQMLIQEKSSESLDSRSMPHRDQLHQDLLEFKAYHLWGCDRHGECVVGTNANRIESVDKVLSFSLIDHH
ncbi:MAG: hypothetical protein A2199_03065 [Hydrogenophilales bacterium RIFOXYA1_FULL_63_33]|nr:MAG: hypothetical protein A2199_03065 [Hydrogenophilales bacterium RIFOXYA1_FULL_63_33]